MNPRVRYGSVVFSLWVCCVAVRASTSEGRRGSGWSKREQEGGRRRGGEGRGGDGGEGTSCIAVY